MTHFSAPERRCLLLTILTLAVTCSASFSPAPQPLLITTRFSARRREKLPLECDQPGYDRYHTAISAKHPSWLEEATERRDVINLFLGCFLPFVSSANAAVFTREPRERSSNAQPRTQPFGVSDKAVSSLVFDRMLGRGTYKTVYLVSGYDEEGTTAVRYALAVERLRGKSDTKDAFRGVRIAEQLRQSMQGQDKELFEHIEGWWLQSSGIPDFVQGTLVFPKLVQTERTQKEPGKFLGSRWLVSLKPVYDMDLKSFAQKAPVLYPILEQYDQAKLGTVEVIAGLPLSEATAMQLGWEMIRAGKLIHETGLIHRDIKPKNIMLSGGRPVIIDYGFAQFGRPEGAEQRMCVVQQGQVKGEVRYVLSQDVAKYRGCQEGDAYAMGKTLYEFIFGSAQQPEPSGRQAITEAEAIVQNERFRSLLFADSAGSISRFRLSQAASECLISVIRSLCRKEKPMSFAEAEKFFVSYFHPS